MTATMTHTRTAAVSLRDVRKVYGSRSATVTALVRRRAADLAGARE